ncbi:hypothetical protein MPSEU_000332400 [Mayamaea pseudoterrestris]|nr:hypothetical protein MPSEU_000332400 [Mayamaea pseudoterrestris]
MKNDMKKLRDAGHEAIRKKESLIFMNDQQDYFSAVVDLLRTYIFLGNRFADQLFQLTRGSEEMVTLFRKLFGK